MTDFTRVPFPVYIEDTGETIILQLTAAEAMRAKKNGAFLLQLINEERQKIKAVPQICKTGEGIVHMNEDLSLSPGPSSFASEVDALHIPPSETSTQSVDESTESDKSLFIWTSKNIYLLLERYEERMTEFSSGTKRHSKIWESIASDMNKIDPGIAVSGTQCQSKMNSMKKMYRKIIDHNSISGNDRKSWQYFEKMYELFGKSGWANPKATASEAGPSSSASSTDENINIMEVPATKKPKSEKALDEFLKQMKQDKQEREKKREERKLFVLQELKEQKEKQHREKMDMMKKFYEAISGKKLFD